MRAIDHAVVPTPAYWESTHQGLSRAARWVLTHPDRKILLRPFHDHAQLQNHVFAGPFRLDVVLEPNSRERMVYRLLATDPQAEDGKVRWHEYGNVRSYGIDHYIRRGTYHPEFHSRHIAREFFTK